MNAPPSSRRFSYQDALDFLYDRINYERLNNPSGANRSESGSEPETKIGAASTRSGYNFRLRRTRELIERLGLSSYLSPEDSGHQDSSSENDRFPAIAPQVPVVHVAGTKGKGSTATMVSQILMASGRKVGLFTSPHLTHVEERFRINGLPCTHDDLCQLVEQVAPVVLEMESTGEPLSFFELTTAMAILHFDRQHCNAIVLEVGLGGRLDSTNVCTSSIAAITSIGLDHQRVLGDTIAEIASEKAGIIKSKAPVISGATHPDAAPVIENVAKSQKATLQQYEKDFLIENRRLIPGGCCFEYRQSGADESLEITLPLEGAHQADNAALAITIAKSLGERSGVTDQHIQQGLQEVQLVGRLERFQLANQIQVIVDTAHNHDSFVALCDAIRSRLQASSDPKDSGALRSPVVAVYGSSRDKDTRLMIDPLSGVIDQFVGTQFTSNPRFLPLDQLRQEIADQEVPSPCFIKAPLKALHHAIELASPSGTVIVCGSFFLAGELREEVIRLAASSASECGNHDLDGTAS